MRYSLQLLVGPLTSKGITYRASLGLGTGMNVSVLKLDADTVICRQSAVHVREWSYGFTLKQRQVLWRERITLVGALPTVQISQKIDNAIQN